MTLARRNPAAARAAVLASVISLGAELAIQTNATLAELARMPDAGVDESVIRQLADLLTAVETLIASTHFSGNASMALRQSDNPRGGTAADALEAARHWLRVLDALYGPKAEDTRG